MTVAEVGLAAPPRLAGLGMIGAFTTVLVALLALVFPTGSEYAHLTAETRPDAYSIAYLEVLTRANPQELDLRVVYARQLAELGRYDEALARLQPVLLDPRLGPAAKHDVLDITLARARWIPEGDPARAAAFSDVHAQLVALSRSPPRSVKRGETLAELALALDDPALAAQFYDDLAKADGEGRRRHWRSAGVWYRAAGNNRIAAERFKLAHDAAGDTRDSPEAVELALQAVATLEAAGDPLPAADLAAAYLGQHPTDRRILSEATRLATASSRPAAARDFGRRLLQQAPDDDALQRAQAQRELLAGDAKAALRLLNRVLARSPDDYAMHLLRARVAEWAGDLDTAERDLLWLVAHPRKQGPLK